MSTDYETYSLGDWKLKRGGTIPDAQIAYKTFGDSSSPAIIYPTWYSGSIEDNEWLIGEDKTLNPKKYFIIITALFGNGQSSSPSNRPDLKPFPEVTFYDNVRAQYELVTKKLGVKHARCVLGWSMGAGQTYQWATQYPDFMDLVVPFCGSAKTSLHNQVMLEGVKVAMLSGKTHASAGVSKGEATQGEYRNWTDEERTVGMKALGRVYAGWGFSQPFYRERLYEKAPTLGFKDLEDFMVNFWEAWALSKGKFPCAKVNAFAEQARSRKYVHDAIYLASWRLLGSGAVQRRFRRGNEGDQSKGSRPSRPDRPVLPYVRFNNIL